MATVSAAPARKKGRRKERRERRRRFVRFFFCGGGSRWALSDPLATCQTLCSQLTLMSPCFFFGGGETERPPPHPTQPPDTHTHRLLSVSFLGRSLCILFSSTSLTLFLYLLFKSCCLESTCSTIVLLMAVRFKRNQPHFFFFANSLINFAPLLVFVCLFAF